MAKSKSQKREEAAARELAHNNLTPDQRLERAMRAADGHHTKEIAKLLKQQRSKVSKTR